MVAVDTNLLIRYFVRDDEKQYKMVLRLFGDLESQNETIFISDIVMVEFVWVLISAYQVEKQDLIQTLKIITSLELFEFKDKSIVHKAIGEFENLSGDFADYMIGQNAAKHQSLPIYTFDKKLKSSVNFKVL